MQKFPEDIECVIPSVSGIGSIYISNIDAASNLKTLARYNIKAVLTSCRGYVLNHTAEELPYYLYLPADDHEAFNISQFFEEAVDFLDAKLRKTNVLVHCMAGVSRSVTLVMAYLISKHGHSTQSAYSTIKRQRNKINPNTGFIQQLRQFEQKILIDKKLSTRQQQKHYSPSNAARYETKTSTPNPSFVNNESRSPLKPSKISLTMNQTDGFPKPLTRTNSNKQWGHTGWENSKEVNMRDYDLKLKDKIRQLQVQNIRLQSALRQNRRPLTVERKPIPTMLSRE